jgi:hypothetical protein
MRAGRRGSIGVACVLLLAIGTGVSAHRRDEYLQAARIAIEPDGVAIELDLTPGAAVAAPILAAIDADGDGSLSDGERRAYTQRVTGAVSIVIDGRLLPLTLTSSGFPDLAAARRGEDAVRLRLQAATPFAAPGLHHLYFSNAHLPEHSVYLANALVPESPRVTVTAQRRTADQRAITIDYTLADAAAPMAARVVTGLGVVALALLPLARRGSRRPA